MRRALDRRFAAIAAFAGILAGCTAGLDAVQDPPRAAAVTTGGPWASMIYAARVEGGVVVFDLGSQRSGRSLGRVLDELDATPEEVVAVFLTHSHRDHVAAWHRVRHARFIMQARERGRFFGDRPHRAPVPRLADRLSPPDLPDEGEVEAATFEGDAAFAFGADTVYAFSVPGHTPGSAAYGLRGVLLLGDAVSHTPGRGFHPARRIYSDDRARSRRSVAALWDRLPAGAFRTVCTAHARCAAPDSAFRAAVR